MHDWKDNRASGQDVWTAWYQAKLAEIIAVVESDESRRFAGEIKTLEKCLKSISSISVYQQLNADNFKQTILNKLIIRKSRIFLRVK